VPTVEGIHLLYLEINKIFSLSCQPICNSADQYTEQWNALDIIAERIRSLGFAAPGTYKQFVKLASIKEVEGVPKAKEMIQLLVDAHEAVARTARSIYVVVDEANDQPTADVLTQRLDVHEKIAWMLRSLLEE